MGQISKIAASRERPHIGGMEKSRGEARLNPKPLKVGTDWQIVAHFPSGEVERIRGFQSEVEALQWINDASGAWLTKRS